MKHITIFLILMLSVSAAQAQNMIHWMSWDEAVEANKSEPKKFFVKVETDWCQKCKEMDRTTFVNQGVVSYLNKNFHPVRLDAENDQTLTYKGKEYRYVNRGSRGYHELALVLTQGKLQYPTYVFLDDDMSIIQPIPGFLTSGGLMLIMEYFNDDHYKNIPWKTYVNQSRLSDNYVHPVKN